MKLALGVVALFSLVLPACARSFGLRAPVDGYGCNLMTAKFGCSGGWGYDLRIRTQCNQPTPPGQPQTIMWWAGAPNTTEDFTLRTGEGALADDPKEYVPGERIPLYITAAKSGHFYEGLLMYAVDSKENKVGDWEVPIEANPDYIAHPGTTCSQSVMHASANYKRRVTRFSFFTPPVGTGTITFRVMWKDGQPNPTDHGGFWIPPKNLTLTEKGATTESVWSVAAPQETCATTCTARGMGCTVEALTGPRTLADEAELLRVYSCDKAVFSECNAPGPRVVSAAEHLCGFLDTKCSGRTTAAANCNAVSTKDVPLLCKCVAGVTNAAGQAKPQFALLFAMLFASALSLRNPPFLFALCLLGLFSTAHAHNWIEGSRGRAKDLQASTVQPALRPVHPEKIDIQIYLGQEIQIEWATAHGGTNYFVVMSQSDEGFLDLNTEESLEDYLQNAPANSDHDGPANVTSSPWQKFARNGQSSALGTTYAAAIDSSNAALWMGNRPATWPYRLNGGGNFQYSYPQSQIAKDRRAAYVSTKYPWIEAVHKYTNLVSEVDAIRLTIPARKGAGRYIIQYIWTSYRDIYDIDIHAPPTPGATVANPYGQFANSSEVTYMQFDHCIFEGVQFLTSCWEAPSDGIHAKKKCDAAGECLGYALVPARPLPGPWSDYSPLPYLRDGQPNTGCNRSELNEKAAPDGLASYTVQYYRSFDNGAAPPWTIFTDPENIGWFSTCFVKLSPLKFDLPVTSLPKPEASAFPYRFGNKCIPCEDRGMSLANGPRWRVADYCVDCDKEPAAAKRNTNKVPALASKNANTMFDADFRCQQDGAMGDCPKIKWITLAGSAWMWEQDCIAKVATTPGCSKNGAWFNGNFDFRYVADWFYSNFQAGKNCMCWRDTAGAPVTKADTNGWGTFTLA